MSLKIKRMIDLAASAAKFNNDRRRHFYLGAAAVRADGVIVTSRNTSNRVVTPYIHAETRVLRKCGFGCTLYVARVKRDGSYGLARPCARCMSAIKTKKVNKIYYTTEDGIEVINF
jgi:tRNA(Arg) A34 adenosine deaminase TadA